MVNVFFDRLRKDPKWLGFHVLPFFFLLFNAVCSLKADASQDQIKIIESNLSREQLKYEKFDTREKDLLRQVSELEQDVEKKRNSVEGLRKKIRLADNDIEKLEEKRTHLEKLLDDTEAKAGKRLVALYKYARKGYIKTLVDVMDMKELWQRMIYLRAISEQDTKELRSLTHQTLEYNRSISEITKKIEKKKAVEKEESEMLANLRKGLEQKVIHLMRIHKEKEFYETAVKELQVAAKDLKQTFSSIEKKQQDETSWISRFSEYRQKLNFPLKGKIIKGNKLLGANNLNFGKGIFIEGPDTEVKAVFPGRVDFSGNLKGYGEIIIINHGSRYFTISAQLDQRIKEEGEKVAEGEIIGFVAQNGSAGDARVYFEIRKAGVSLDPLEWLKKQ